MTTPTRRSPSCGTVASRLLALIAAVVLTVTGANSSVAAATTAPTTSSTSTRSTVTRAVAVAAEVDTNASTPSLVAAGDAVAASACANSQRVGPHEDVLPGQRRVRGPDYDRMVVGFCVAAETGGARFVVNGAGEALDTARVTIPEGKFGYLLENPSKAGVFADSMGFDRASLGSALRQHLVDNFGNASASEPMFGGGTKFSVTGPLTGPSGAKWGITTAWGVDPDGVVRLITATP